ncbi:MAG: hypothetical protein KDB14_00995 [Planctomycetales bacterium]|nr:hypothetical protein [Planctomycetales bacterium]
MTRAKVLNETVGKHLTGAIAAATIGNDRQMEEIPLADGAFLKCSKELPG